MMLAENVHGGRLRSKFARLFDESNLGPNLKLGEIPVHHTFTMEINSFTFRRFDVPVIGARIELDHAPMRRCRVRLDVAALAAHVILELPTDRVERVADGDADVFVRSEEH